MSIIPCRDGHRRVRPALRFVFPAVIILTVLVLAPAPQAGSWSGTITEKEGVAQVLNPAAPMEAPLVVPLTERWRRGADDSEEVIFALLDDIAVADDGAVYVLDSQLCEVQVFSPAGEYVRTIGRQGEGPGEFTFPRGIIITPEGLIGVVQSMPGKIVLLTPEGDAAGNYPLPEMEGMFTIQATREAGGRVFLHMRTTTTSDNNQIFHDVESIVRLTPEGRIDATMASSERETDFSRLVFDEKKMGPVSAWAGAGDGTMFVADSFDDYRIKVWSPDGKHARTIEREFTPRKRNADERKRRGPLVRVSTGDGDLETTMIKSETDRSVLNVFPREGGGLWVLTSRGAFDTAEGELCVLDEFDAEGRFVRELHLKGEGDLDTDAMEIRGNRVFVLTDRQSARYAMMAQDSGDSADDAAPMTLICYELDGKLTLRDSGGGVVTRPTAARRP